MGAWIHILPTALLGASRERGESLHVLPAAIEELNSWMIFLPNCVYWGPPTPLVSTRLVKSQTFLMF